MKIQPTPELIALVKQYEGCKLKAYQCPAGIWTCGYGTTGKTVGKDTVFTQEEADRHLIDDLVRAIESAVVISPILGQSANRNKLMAIASFIYNLGAGAYGGSTLRKKIDAGSFQSAAEQFGRWINAGGKPLPGLVKRREAERQMFLA